MFVKTELEVIGYALSYSSLKFMPEFEVRVRVLKRLGYLGAEDQLKLKGNFWRLCFGISDRSGGAHTWQN